MNIGKSKVDDSWCTVEAWHSRDGAPGVIMAEQLSAGLQNRGEGGDMCGLGWHGVYSDSSCGGHGLNGGGCGGAGGGSVDWKV